uniref:Uncharacterized protein n=1 Tax=Globodera rostochiensis TaxID=31243 RepID=A0A914GSN4_GLORO
MRQKRRLLLVSKTLDDFLSENHQRTQRLSEPDKVTITFLMYSTKTLGLHQPSRILEERENAAISVANAASVD